ncbi:MAG: hypothetical protein H7644_14605 [Candidatus Heimdallarchaeota archaeon]|nr:hypothetical protein [Candidatus Heimdallarchaeota archaeon]MCK5144994.1 hypothetical protein [Candidatus Heimdallarchaeota archaeon]
MSEIPKTAESIKKSTKKSETNIFSQKNIDLVKQTMTKLEEIEISLKTVNWKLDMLLPKADEK